MTKVFLKSGREKRVFSLHPWVFRSDIDRVDGSISPGDNYFYQMALYKYIFENQIEGAKVTKESFLLPLEKS